MSWFISPLLSGVAAVILYSLLKFVILSKGPLKTQRALLTLPFFYAIVIFLNVFSILFTGSHGLYLLILITKRANFEIDHSENRSLRKILKWSLFRFNFYIYRRGKFAKWLKFDMIFFEVIHLSKWLSLKVKFSNWSIFRSERYRIAPLINMTQSRSDLFIEVAYFWGYLVEPMKATATVTVIAEWKIFDNEQIFCDQTYFWTTSSIRSKG